MSVRSANKYHSPSPGKGYSPSKLSTKASGLGIQNNNSSMRSSNGKGMRSTNEFNKHLKNLQHQADENIEDEYIKNLQQQIAYQELELKLLKEKELEQKQSVSQIDKFFNDGVPLNENILALKNQYNHIKKTMENKMDDLNDHRVIELKIAADLKIQYERNNANLKTIIEALDKKEKDFSANMSELRMAYLNEKHRREEHDRELKRLQQLLKGKNTENLQMARDLERENFLVVHRAEDLKNKRLKTAEALQEKEKWLNELQEDVEKKKGQAKFNPEVTILRNENTDFAKKNLMCEKEIHMAEAKVKEMEMYLEMRSKEREHEADLKRTLLAQIEQVKFWIEEQNNFNEFEIKKRVEDKEISEKKTLTKEIEDVKIQKTIIKQRHETKEDNIKEMAQEKMGLQQDILALEQETVGIEKEIKENKEQLILLRNSKEALKQEQQELEDKLAPVVADNGKMSERIPLLEAENVRTKEQIAHLEKLNELSIQIKNVNLEELKLLTQSNDQVQNTITDLMRKWDFLQRVGTMGKPNQY